MELLRWVMWVSASCLLAYGDFLSRPDLHPHEVRTITNELSSNDSDLILVTAYRSTQDGPAIYTTSGELVWDGHEASSSEYTVCAGNLRTIQYNGSTHLMYTRFKEDELGYKHIPKHQILNGSYVIVATFKALDASTELDGHDSEISEDGRRFLQAAKIEHAGRSNETGLKEAVFQEVDLARDKLVFEWRSLDNVPSSDSCITQGDPDYFHINSVHKDVQNNYLVVGYNVCKAYYIDGRTGAILWTLGGANSSFKIVDPNNDNYELRHMHHARIQPLSLVHLPNTMKADISPSTHIAISVLDNAFGATKSLPTASFSSALVILLDLQFRIAHIIERYPHPRGITAAMFGSVSLSPNGDRFVGWGSARGMSQFNPSGHLVYDAEFGNDNALIGSYRAFKAPWVGRPNTKPDVYAYAWGCKWRSVVYVSWNGATEVRSYRVFGAMKPEDRFILVAEVDKGGFETMVEADRYVEYAFVEALDRDGVALGSSEMERMYRPPLVEGRGCSEWRCPATLNLPRDEGSCGDDEGTDMAGGDEQVVLGWS